MGSYVGRDYIILYTIYLLDVDKLQLKNIFAIL